MILLLLSHNLILIYIYIYIIMLRYMYIYIYICILFNIYICIIIRIHSRNFIVLELIRLISSGGPKVRFKSPIEIEEFIRPYCSHTWKPKRRLTVCLLKSYVNLEVTLGKMLW